MNGDLSLEADSGELTFLIQAPPASLQTTRTRKDVVTDLIRQQTTKRDFLVSGDVQIDVECMLNERLRYETHLSPDVDNILKPTLDALCGPNGVLLDDCQVQAISCRWIDWTRLDEQFEIRIRFSPDVRVAKHGLAFVHMGDSLCFPFNADLRNTLEAMLSNKAIYRSPDALGPSYEHPENVTVPMSIVSCGDAERIRTAETRFDLPRPKWLICNVVPRRFGITI